MKKFFIKLSIVTFFCIMFLILVQINSNAAVTMSVTPSTTTVEPGKTFSITVKVSGGAGYVNISATNATLSKTTSGWLDNSSETITCTAGNTDGKTISISVKGEIGDFETETDVIKSASTNIKIKKKEEVKQTTATTTNNSSTNKQNTTTSTPKKQTTIPKVETKTEEKKEDNFYISNVILKGIKENNEQVNIELSPGFNKNIYEYTCNVTEDVQKIEIEKEAGEYTNSIIVTGLEEIKEGENIIKLQLSAEDHEAKIYTIKVIKEKQEIIETVGQSEENKQEEIKENKETKMISMPLWIFIIMQISIILVEVIIMYFIIAKNLFKFKNKDIDIDR